MGTGFVRYTVIDFMYIGRATSSMLNYDTITDAAKW